MPRPQIYGNFTQTAFVQAPGPVRLQCSLELTPRADPWKSEDMGLYAILGHEAIRQLKSVQIELSIDIIQFLLFHNICEIYS